MKKQSLKRLLLAAATMITMAATGIAASAAPATQVELTVKASEPGHKFEAYQVFGGDYTEENGKGILSNIRWGTALEAESAQFLTALKADPTIGSHFTNADSAAAVAEALQNAQNFAENSDNLDLFAVIVAEHLGTGTLLTEGTKDGDIYPYKATLAPGYYLIKDQDGSSVPNGSYTKFMLELISNMEVDAKLDTPSIEKQVTEDTQDGKTNAAGIGSEVTFKLTSRVPEMDGYNRYYFIVQDTLSKGLQYTGDEDLSVTIGSSALTQDTDYTVTADTEANGETGLKIVFKDFYEKNKNRPGAAITIQYKAEVTRDAVVGNQGNKNTAKLTYSNDPRFDYKGDGPDDPENPDPGNVPTGETTETTTHTYTAQLKVAKVDEKGMPLSGAEFELSGTGVKAEVNTEKRSTTTYVRDDNGGFVEVDGKMVAYDEAQHAGKDRYNQVTVEDTIVTVKDSDGTTSKIKAAVDANGYIVFTGLGKGTYTLTETKAPEGYNKLDKPITVTLDCQLPADYIKDQTCTWKATGANVQADGTILLKVENKKGSMLPSTGGMGTTIFTVSGLALMLGAALLLILKKKRDRF